jgi:hypothetical protein
MIIINEILLTGSNYMISTKTKFLNKNILDIDVV